MLNTQFSPNLTNCKDKVCTDFDGTSYGDCANILLRWNCSDQTVESDFKPIPNFNEQQFTICSWVNGACVIADLSTFDSSRCYSKSPYTYTWTQQVLNVSNLKQTVIQQAIKMRLILQITIKILKLLQYNLQNFINIFSINAVRFLLITILDQEVSFFLYKNISFELTSEKILRIQNRSPHQILSCFPNILLKTIMEKDLNFIALQASWNSALLYNFFLQKEQKKKQLQKYFMRDQEIVTLTSTSCKIMQQMRSKGFKRFNLKLINPDEFVYQLLLCQFPYKNCKVHILKHKQIYYKCQFTNTPLLKENYISCVQNVCIRTGLNQIMS